MELQNFVVLNAYTLFLLVISYFFTPKKVRRTERTKIFNLLRILLFIVLISDTIGRFQGNHSSCPIHLFFRYGFLVTYLLDPLFHYFMIKYVNTWIDEDVSKIDRKYFWIYLASIAIIVNSILVILSEFTSNPNLIYYYDNNNTYHRGALFLPRMYYLAFTMVLVEIFIVRNLKNIKAQNKKFLLFFPVIPSVLGMIQVFILPQMSLEYTGVYISCMIISQFIQKQDIFTDGLTGVTNRKGFDKILNERISLKQSKFSLIMIDLDYFKEINDTYGHLVGDEALKDISNILVDTFRQNDIIARYGGDEFCVITDISDENILSKTIERFKKNVEDFNAKKQRDYDLSASVGYQIFNKKDSIESFLRKVDEIMYIEKKRKHGEI